MHKGQARFRDDRSKYFVAWCGQCWFKTQCWFDRSVSNEDAEKMLKAEHDQHNRLLTQTCGADVRIRQLEEKPKP